MGGIVMKILGVLYFPVYVAFWLLHKITRFVLAITYIGLLKWQIAKSIFKSLIRKHGEY